MAIITKGVHMSVVRDTLAEYVPDAAPGTVTAFPAIFRVDTSAVPILALVIAALAILALVIDASCFTADLIYTCPPTTSNGAEVAVLLP